MGTQVAACLGPVNSAAEGRCRWPQWVWVLSPGQPDEIYLL